MSSMNGFYDPSTGKINPKSNKQIEQEQQNAEKGKLITFFETVEKGKSRGRKANITDTSTELVHERESNEVVPHWDSSLFDDL